MNIKSLALVMAATAALVGGGMGAVACSSSSSNNNSGSSSSGGSSGGSSGSGSGSSSGGGNVDSGNEDSGEGDGGMSATCDSSIPKLHANPAGDVYCGYASDDSGTALDCVADAGMGFCCLGGSVGGGNYAPQQCAATAAGCTNGGSPDAGGSAAIPIQCNQISDCAQNGAPGATACCLQGASAPATVAGCGYPKSKGGNAVVCEGDGGGTTATPCAAGEVQICSADPDCPSGMHCIPGKWKIYQIGFCQ